MSCSSVSCSTDACDSVEGSTADFGAWPDAIDIKEGSLNPVEDRRCFRLVTANTDMMVSSRVHTRIVGNDISAHPEVVAVVSDVVIVLSVSSGSNSMSEAAVKMQSDRYIAQ